MKIVSWNCRGRFRDKYPAIQALDADIYVIQECENPEKYKRNFEGFFTDYVWYGEKDSKGLAIFIRPEIKYCMNDWPVYCLRHFLSLRINDTFNLLGVWAGPPYIEEYCIYQAINIDRYDENTIIIGDFNSNAIWDKQHGMRNHSIVVDQLKNKGFVSAYHHISGEKHGDESQNTFCLYKNPDKRYHIDYCFLNPEHIANFKILNEKAWLELSDHYPIQIEIHRNK